MRGANVMGLVRGNLGTYTNKTTVHFLIYKQNNLTHRLPHPLIIPPKSIIISPQTHKNLATVKTIP